MSTDLTNLTDSILKIYTSEELIAVNQDPLGIITIFCLFFIFFNFFLLFVIIFCLVKLLLGVQGDLIYQKGPVQIWAGPLSDGSRAIVMFNRHTYFTFDKATITLKFTDIGLQPGTTAVVSPVLS